MPVINDALYIFVWILSILMAKKLKIYNLFFIQNIYKNMTNLFMTLKHKKQKPQKPNSVRNKKINMNSTCLFTII
jgi:hypothetical protein